MSHGKRKVQSEVQREPSILLLSLLLFSHLAHKGGILQGPTVCPALEPEMHWTLAGLMSLGQRDKGQGDFPGGTVERNLPASAGDTGSVPGLGRSHIWQGNEAWAPQAESSPCSLQLEKARAQQ